MTSAGNGMSRVRPPFTRTPRNPHVASRCQIRKVATDSTYQTMRGGRIAPVGASANRRPERELTHALLLIEYHLEHGKHWAQAQRMSCLTDIVIAVQDLLEEPIFVAARVRDRLRHAKKNEALQIWKSEYLDA